ncbi:XRE family transcriptional regulator [Chitinophaga sp. RCC_12]|uniref:XRE family transcriptional regulator n=1 Tax=Chitinophaga sp. RCC_12 TaxID=3239226 RepID=UPI0035234629
MNNENYFWAQNIKFLRNRKKLTQEALSGKLNLKRSTLSAHENGQISTLSPADLVRYSEFFKISIDAMVRIDLSTLGELKLRELEAGNDVYSSGAKLRVLATTVSPDNKDQVEMVTQKAKAGYALGYGDPDFVASLPVFHMPQLPKDKKFRMFPVSGDSMLPVPEGSYVIVEYIQDWTEIKDGTACIVVTKNDGLVFKVVYNRIGEDKALTLVSLNPSFKPYEVPVIEILEIWKYNSYWTNSKLEPQASTDAILTAINNLHTKIEAISTNK